MRASGTMAAIQCDENMGNSMNVLRVPTDKFNGAEGGPTQPICDRGALVFFDTPTMTRGQATRISALADPRFNNTGPRFNDLHSYGVLSEAVVDAYRRKQRPGRQPVPFVLPVTTDGVDIATAENRHAGFLPGDPVFYDNTNHKLTHETGSSCFFLGIAHHNAAPNTFAVQLRVDTFGLMGRVRY